MQSKNLQTGFTLIELAIALIIAGTIAAFTIQATLIQSRLDEIIATADRVVDEIRQITKAAGAWSYAHDGFWPGEEDNDCRNAITKLQTGTPAYLNYIDASSPYHADGAVANYKTSCDTKTFFVELTTDKNFTDLIANKLVNNTATGNVVITAVGKGNFSISASAFLRLNDDGALKEDLNMGDNKITDLEEPEDRSDASTKGYTDDLTTIIGTVCDQYNPRICYKPVISPNTEKVWLDRNLGATKVCEDDNDSACYGYLYQWGRSADGHQLRNSLITDNLGRIPPNHSKFITITNNNEAKDWVRGGTDLNGRQRSATWNDICPQNYRVPTHQDFQNEITVFAKNTKGEGLRTGFLKLVPAGHRNSFGAKKENLSNYWTINTGLYPTKPTLSSTLRISTKNASIEHNRVRSYGYPVRCVKG